MKILAIESSADETAAAIVDGGTNIISNVIASSATMHRKYGGIVPEVAARRQLEFILPVISEALEPCALKNIDAIAVTVGPGLIGGLLVGVETAKTIAFVTSKPIIPVNHVLAHMYANFIPSPVEGENSSRAQSRDNQIQFPAISLVASGGHTELYLMKSVKQLQWLGGTLDDAAGECFDKTARLLGFENGGASIQSAAEKCHPGLDPGSTPKNMDSGSEAGMTKKRIKLPRPMIDDVSLNFSFSGLKTAVLREWTGCHPGLDPGSTQKNMDSGSEAGMTEKALINAFAHEIQEAITDVLVKKTVRAARQYNVKSILLSGGVASNVRLREKFSILNSPFSIHAPSPTLCTDNAVYIASYAYFRGKPTDWHEVTAVPDLSVEL